MATQAVEGGRRHLYCTGDLPRRDDKGLWIDEGIVDSLCYLVLAGRVELGVHPFSLKTMTSPEVCPLGTCSGCGNIIIGRKGGGMRDYNWIFVWSDYLSEETSDSKAVKSMSIPNPVIA